MKVSVRDDPATDAAEAEAKTPAWTATQAYLPLKGILLG